MRAGDPNNASGRLLPVDVKPGTRQSLTVFGHLDRHGPEQLHFTDVERRAMADFAHRAHDAVGIARLEEIDCTQCVRDVDKQTLQIVYRYRLGWPARRLERLAIRSARH